MPGSTTRPRDFTCEQNGKFCENVFTSTKRQVEKRSKRLGKVMCIPCIKEMHDLIPSGEKGILPPGLKTKGGKQDRYTKTNLTCQVCRTSWETDKSTGQIMYLRDNRRSICKGCRSDSRTWLKEMVPVNCGVCGKEYKITPGSLKTLPLHKRMCASCKNKGRHVSEETRRKISKANTGYRHTAEDIEKIREAASRPEMVAQLLSVIHLSGRFKGKKHSEKTITAMREKMTGRTHTHESRAKMSVSRLAYFDSIGGTYSDETKQKIARSITKLRMEGFKPESGHVQDIYHPKKPQPPFVNPRTTPYRLSSSWETLFAKWLDMNPEVLAWSYESVVLALSDGSPYLTDFVVELTDGVAMLVEVKPRRKIERNVGRAQEKIEAIDLFCEKANEETDLIWLPLVIDDDIIEDIRKDVS